MILLAVDTASKSSSVAIVDPASVIAETTLVKNETHSKHLMAMIDGVLRLAGIAVKDLAAFAVTLGPGSFTGLRIGISAIKGMALASGKPVVGIPTLDALAAPAITDNADVCAMLDARRNEVYAARYRMKDGKTDKLSPEQVVTPLKAIEGITAACRFVGDGAVAYRSAIESELGGRACFGMSYENIVRASVVGHLALKQIKNGAGGHPRTLLPRYIRKSDAEINRMRKSGLTF